MTPTADVETILIVDDEEPVRRTFREWLDGASLGCRILSAADAESALVQANQQAIDLAILDWNLGAGNDGLRLLEDLTVFHPEVVAIMITGYAQQATPLDAMRMGVRDYLDKNQDLNRETFLKAVRRQLERIRPARRERHLHVQLLAFREAVAKVLPLVQSAAAMNDPVPLPAAVGTLFRFLQQTVGAGDGVLLARSYDDARQPPEVCRVYDVSGQALDVDLVPFSRSVAGTVLSLQEPFAMGAAELTAAPGTMELQSFERSRTSLLAIPLSVAPAVQVVLELFDKHDNGGVALDFSAADRRLAAAAGDFAADLLRHGLAERHSQRVLFDAVGAALGASDAMSAAMQGSGVLRPEAPPAPAIMDRLRTSLEAGPEMPVEAADTLRLAEAIRVLAIRHGPRAVDHCTKLIESVRSLLDESAGNAT